MSSHKKVEPKRLLTLRFSVFALTGLLFVAVAQTNASPHGSRHDVDLSTLVRNKQDTVDLLLHEVADFQEEIATVTQSVTPSNSSAPLPAGWRGPGVSVSLWDAPSSVELPEGASADDLVIHQGDIEAVFNALWTGGAETVAISDVEVLPNTLVRCVGNVININGRLFSPPFTITAIGDPLRLQRALAENEAIAIFQQYVNRYHLGFQVVQSSDIVINRVKTKTDYKFVKVLDDNGSSR